MTILKAEERNTSLKAKQLRRSGFVPGILYNNDSDKSLSLQFSQKDVDNLLKSNAIGVIVELAIGKKKHPALLKEISFTAATNKAEHLSFMPLVKGETITSVAHIILNNREKIKGSLQQLLFEISYKALPQDLIEKIEIDLEEIEIGTSVRVADLEIAQNPALEILESPDSLVYAVSEIKNQAEEEDVTETEKTENDS